MNNEKKIEDYLHLYIGCEVKTGTGQVTLVGIHKDEFNGVCDAVVLNGNYTHTTKIGGLKPILRPLSSMTEEEFNELELHGDGKMERLPNGFYHSYNSDELTRRYLSKGFDLFQLIEAGLAIDSTKEVAASS